MSRRAEEALFATKRAKASGMIADRPGSVSAFEQGNTAYGRSLEGSLCQERAEGGSVGLVEQLGLGEQLAAAGHRGSPAQEGSPDHVNDDLPSISSLDMISVGAR